VYAVAVARAVAAGEADLGILICGTGIGMSIAANKVAGARAAHCGDSYSARMARAHNAANIVCMGSRVIGVEIAKDIMDAFVDTAIDAGANHARRRVLLAALDAEREAPR
jgi:ribose 5-phosphate isomerase B